MTDIASWDAEEDRTGWPPNVRVGSNSVVTGERIWTRFFSTREPGVSIGDHCTILGAQLAVGVTGSISVGDYCHMTNPVLLSESEVRIGNYVVIGWNATITDADFHPLSPAERIQDALALSPLGSIADRPPFETKPVIIGDDVYIGHLATILKGVHVHRGAWIEPGAVVTKDVLPGARVIGNPAMAVLET